ncbi:cache domain-containing sensor histidine kinase [Paenibacillus radicis (ex Xue et al. 2023)]|uniref:histidine kinase n=1 Tax=Paenibacillus radicis (ex Xue et al. 2023) TaxID=2972489 RepID=A0ABT1YIW1_9BACL|nr:sensor histidine kinase [Paenibacillus radicis (ex Xue et al. 2023)]MCR8633124.1 sensor histidine kinase [Paenibacillus radicis (ex Xue et al. 2023)]
MKFWSFSFKSIHTNIAIAFSCLILCTTAILSYNSYRLSADAVTKNSLEYTTELIEQVNTNIQTYIGNMESISALALSNGDLLRYLSLYDPNTNEGIALERQLGNYFRSIVASRNDIASILFVGSNGRAVSDRASGKLKSYGELTEQEWFKEAELAQGRVAISSSHVQHVFRNEYTWVVSISRQLMGNAGDGRTGVLLVDLNYNLINDLCKQIRLGQRGYIFILDPAGDLIYHPQQQIIYTQLKSENIPMILSSQDSSIIIGEGSERKMYTIRTTSFGWKIVGVTYLDELVSNKREIQFSSALWGFVCLIIALAISILLSFTLTKPIKKLDAHMKQVEKGDFNIRAAIESTNEIGKLARTFNLMIGKIKDLMNQIVYEQETKRISELKALQAQIQPHFLYNTLDSIIWMAEMSKMEDVVKMTSALSKLLRSSISKGEELVPISVELEHIRNYLTIQNIRYRNKFSYTIDVDPSILSCKILKIVLQPLVENAIYHGIKHKVDTGHIRITGQQSNGVVILKVIDDGIGMESEKVKTLLSNVNLTEGGKGVGLHNVNQRVQLYFGDPYGLEFESEQEEGTTAILRIPAIWEGEDGQ